MKTMKMIITELTKKQDKAILLTQHYSVALLMWYLGFGVEVVQCISVVIVQFSSVYCFAMIMNKKARKSMFLKI